MRIGCDLDGTLADMTGALSREAEALFGRRFAVRRDAPLPVEPDAAPELAPTVDPAGHAADPAEAPHDAEEAPELTASQQQKVWRRVGQLENFWTTLSEIEPGAVAELGLRAAEDGWEVLFLTQRPATAGETSQLQSQRWLEAHGFTYPSVFVASGDARGRIAEALQLDVVIDDRPANCLEVALASRARPILVWRDDPGLLPPGVTRHGIDVVRSFAEALAAIQQMQRERRASRRGFFAAARRALGT